jgi:hypothetical protein
MFINHHSGEKIAGKTSDTVNKQNRRDDGCGKGMLRVQPGFNVCKSGKVCGYGQ